MSNLPKNLYGVPLPTDNSIEAFKEYKTNIQYKISEKREYLKKQRRYINKTLDQEEYSSEIKAIFSLAALEKYESQISHEITNFLDEDKKDAELSDEKFELINLKLKYVLEAKECVIYLRNSMMEIFENFQIKLEDAVNSITNVEDGTLSLKK